MMSDRERWIVYPLLLASLAMGIQTRWVARHGNTSFNVVTCRALRVMNELNEIQAVIEENAQGAAEIRLAGVEDRAGAENPAEVLLTADEGGGRLVLMRRVDQKSLVLGHDHFREVSGLWAINGNALEAPLASLAIDTSDDEVWELLDWPPAKQPIKKDSKANP